MDLLWQELLKILSVYLFSMLKFFMGPFLGYMAGLNLAVSILVTVCGTMTVVLVLTFFGDFLKRHGMERYLNWKKLLTKYPKVSRIWVKYGIAGIAFLTPLILTPIGGTVLAIGFGTPRERIILFMFLSAAFWSIVQNLAMYLGGEWASKWLN